MVRVVVKKALTAQEKMANFDAAMRLFKKRVQKDGILTEVKSREFYEKPGVKKRKKREANQRARAKKASK